MPTYLYGFGNPVETTHEIPNAPVNVQLARTEAEARFGPGGRLFKEIGTTTQVPNPDPLPQANEQGGAQCEYWYSRTAG